MNTVLVTGGAGFIGSNVIKKLNQSFIFDIIAVDNLDHPSKKSNIDDLNIKEIIGIDMSKQMQSSDWGAEKLSEKQIKYAATDCIFLHQLKKELNKMLIRENRMELLNKCLKFLNTRVDLDLADYKIDIFSH